MGWVLFEETKRWSGGNSKIVASLARNELYIGAVLREAGFDISLKYDLYFDSERRRIGLKPSDRGFKCYVTSHNGPRFRVTRFVERFDLKGEHLIADYETEGDMWVLILPGEIDHLDEWLNSVEKMKCSQCGGQMQAVRPGKIQCGECE